MMDVVNNIEFLRLDSRAPSSLIGLVAKPTSTNEDFIHPHPRHDYYNLRFSFTCLVYSSLFGIGVNSGLLLSALRTQRIRPSDLINPYSGDSIVSFLAPPIPVVLGYIGLCTLLSLVCEIRRPQSRLYRYWCRLLQSSLFVGIIILPSLGLTFVLFLAMICGPLYIIMALVHMGRRVRSRRRANKAAHAM